MYIFKVELKKVINIPMLWIFLVLCLVFNVFIIMTGNYDAKWVNYVSQTSLVTGQRMGSEYSNLLAQLPDSQYRTAIHSQTTGSKNTFEDYKTSDLADIYINLIGLTGTLAEQMKAKYVRLQPVINEMSDNGVSMDFYVGELTYEHFGKLFRGIFKSILTESILFAVLVMLYLLGYESQNKTELLVYSTKTGRQVVRTKVLAGLLMGIVGFILLCGISLTVFFTVYDYSGIWNANVSSQFNYIVEGLFRKPFMTWHSFTVWQYLLATILLSLILITVFSLFSMVLGLLIRNTYISFLIFIALNMGMMTLPFVLSSISKYAFFLSENTPISLWYYQSLWFTEAGGLALWPWFESIGVTIWLLLLGALGWCAIRYFYRRDLV